MSSLKDQIINKVDNIYDTKQAIKRAIEDKGQTIEDDLSFYSYADKIRQITAMEGAVKLFETEEEMQADNTAKENDLAVVYRKEVKNMTVTDKPQYLTFPETVTLPQEITSSYNCTFRSDSSTIMCDIQISLNHSIFRLNCWGSNVNFQVQYRSTDSINYTRERFESGDGQTLTNPVDLTVPIKVYYEGEWDDNIGYFMQVGGSIFDGLYKYGTYTDNYILNSPLVSNPDSYLIMNVNNTPITQFSGITIVKETKLSSDKLTHIPVTYDIYKCPNLEVRGIINNGGQYLLGFMVYQSTGSENSYTYQKYEYVNNELTQTSEVTSTNKLPYFDVSREDSTDSVTTYIELTGTEYVVCGFEGHIKSVKFYTSGIKKSLPTGTLINDDTDYSSKVIEISESEMAYYKLAENQYNLKSSNQLLPDISAYGKNGNITGDGSIYNNLDLSQLFTANGMDIYRDGLVALKESSTGNKIKDVEPFSDGVGFIASNSTINELFKNYKVIRSKSYIIAYNDTTIKLYDLNYNLLQTGTNSRIKELFLTSKLIYEDADKVVHIGFSNNSYDGYCFLVDLSEDGIKITYVSLDFERIDLICYVGEDKEHNGYKYYVVSRNSLQSSSVRIEAFTTTESGVGYTKRISNVSLTNRTDDETSYCCFDDNYVYMTLPPYWRKFIVIDKSTDTIIKNNTSESSIYLCNNVGTCYMNTGGDTNSGVYELNGTSQKKISENKNIPTIFTGLYQYYYIPDYDCIITTMSGGDEVALSTSQGLNEICNFRSLLQPYYNGDMNKGGLNTTLYLNGTKLEGLAVLFPDYTDTNAKVFNISVDFTKTLSNEGDINTLPINNGYIGNLVISQMNNTNYNNTLTPEEYLQALQTAKEIKGNKLNNGVVVNKLVSRKTN